MNREEEVRSGLLDIISDQYKSAYGCRPSLRLYESYSIADLHRELDSLDKEVSRQIEDEREIEAHRALVWDAHIRKLCQDHSIDVKTALRWDMEAERADGDVEYYEYLKGIRYGSVTDYLQSRA